MLQSLSNWLFPLCAQNDYLCQFTKGGMATPASFLNLADKMPLPPYMSQLILAGFVGYYVYQRYSLKEAMFYIKAGLIARGHDPILVEILMTGVEKIFGYLADLYNNWYQPENPTPTPNTDLQIVPRKKPRRNHEETRRESDAILDRNRHDVHKLKPAKSVLHAFPLAAESENDELPTDLDRSQEPKSLLAL